MVFSNMQEKANKKLNELALNVNEEILIHRHDYIETSKQIIYAKWFGNMLGDSDTIMYLLIALYTVTKKLWNKLL